MSLRLQEKLAEEFRVCQQVKRKQRSFSRVSCSSVTSDTAGADGKVRSTHDWCNRRPQMSEFHFHKLFTGTHLQFRPFFSEVPCAVTGRSRPPALTHVFSQKQTANNANWFFFLSVFLLIHVVVFLSVTKCHRSSESVRWREDRRHEFITPSHTKNAHYCIN